MTCPLVILDHWTETMEFNAVLINNADAARMMTEHLLENGHREVGYLRDLLGLKDLDLGLWDFRQRLRSIKFRIKRNIR